MHSDQNAHDVHEPSAVEHPESESASDADRAPCPEPGQARGSIARRAVRISLSQINIRPAPDFLERPHMTNRASATTLFSGHSVKLPRARRHLDRGPLLAGVSVLSLLLSNLDAVARPLGGPQPTPSAAAIAAAQSGSQEAARAAKAAQNSLKRATIAIQAQQASQQASRDAARAALQATPSRIPHGLRAGGLQVAPGATPGSELWQGAKLPTELNDGDRVKVTVEQTPKSNTDVADFQPE
jgi:hypothetical protein